jgi:hypothetical protein
MSSDGSVSASTPQKKQRVDVVNRGFDNIIDFTTSSDLQYIHDTCVGKLELTSFVASMLRDGVIHNAFERKRQSSLVVTHGSKIDPRVKPFKLMPKALCKQFLEELTQKSFNVNSGEEPITTEAFRRAVVVALRVTKDTQLPRKHAFPEYYSPMLCVLHARALDVDAAARVQSLSVHNIDVFGVYRHALGGDKRKVESLYAPYKLITLRFDEDSLTGDAVCLIHDNDSQYEATIECVTTGSKQNLWQLFSKQYLGVNVPADNEWFEYVHAADGLRQIQPAVAIRDQASDESDELADSIDPAVPTRATSEVPLPPS